MASENQGFMAFSCALLGGMGGWAIGGLGTLPESVKASDLLSFAGAVVGVMGAFGAAHYSAVHARSTKLRDNRNALKIYLKQIKERVPQGIGLMGHIGNTEAFKKIIDYSENRSRDFYIEAVRDRHMFGQYDEFTNEVVDFFLNSISDFQWNIMFARLEDDLEKAKWQATNAHAKFRGEIDNALAMLN